MTPSNSQTKKQLSITISLCMLDSKVKQKGNYVQCIHFSISVKAQQKIAGT